MSSEEEASSMPGVSSMDNSKVKFVRKDESGEETIEPLLNTTEVAVVKPNKPFKIQYYKDEKSLQCN